MKIRPDTSFQQNRQNHLDEIKLQAALNELFKNVSEQIPADKMSWIQFHFDLKMLEIIAQSSYMGGEETGFIYNTPEALMRFFNSADLPEIHMINQPEMDPFGKELSRRANLFDWSSLIIFFKNNKGNTYGCVIITVDQKERYTAEYARLFISFKPRLKRILDDIIADKQNKIPAPAQKEPVKDKNEFFRQVTRRLCGNLDLQTGVYQCLQYLSRFMPADALFVRQLEPEFQSERVLAESYGFFHQHTGTLIPWPPVNRDPSDRGRLPGIRIINRPEESSVMKLYTPIFGNDICCISMPLIDKETVIGFAIVGLEGRDRYREGHMALFSLLHDPFVMALSNNIKHRETIRLKNIIEEKRKNLKKALNFSAPDTIIGDSFGLKGVIQKARLVAGQDSPVLLSGETGSGKELIANYIHRKSPRKDGPFIKVNCGAIPDTLLDSELFGHEKGAFTGAGSRKMGRFERADGGTIFLDEIGELPLQAQVRLLQVLQNKTIERVGGTETIPVDVRVIAATHRNLEEMVASGLFREDLWFRLDVFPIRIPPLRSRKMDIPALVDYFIEKKSVELGLHTRPRLSSDAMDRLIAYEWPGNVRELENVIERELILYKGETLTFHNSNPRQKDAGRTDYVVEEDVILPLDEVFTIYVKQVLHLCDGKINGPDGAAAKLKVNPSTLRSRMKKMKISYGMNSK